ncbi:MAG TPA: MBL fold hydrolase [Lachnospiraceae bacterium]|nr:MBL fold hydrolase [Lachnospiraceae bacterium]
MYIRNLVENTCIRYGLQGEHGLSFYIETAGHKVLFDVGASEKFWENARRMGIRLENVDTVILSHGHNDHGGGLTTFFEKNTEAMVYIHQNAFRRHFSDLRKKTGGMLPAVSECADISLDMALRDHDRIVYVDKPMYTIDNELTVLSGIVPLRLQPDTCKRLYEDDGQGLRYDTFSHEQHLVVTEGNRHVLFCGCSHAGIVNILENFRENFGVAPELVVGGFHLSSPRLGTMADERLMEKIAAELMRYENCRYYTCHCTGKQAYEWLRARMGNQIQYVATGDAVTV